LPRPESLPDYSRREKVITHSQEFWRTLWDRLPEIKDFLDSHEDKGAEDRALRSFLRQLDGRDENARMPDGELGDFLTAALGCVKREWEELGWTAPELMKKAARLAELPCSVTDDDALRTIEGFFFPEGTFGSADPGEQEKMIRNRRHVRIEMMNHEPIANPAEEMVFTSNVLLTLPIDDYYHHLSPDMAERVRAVAESEEQKYWFDHPILMGVKNEANEMIYGLKGLAETFRFEKERGCAAPDAEMTVFLSLSVTHDGLKGLAHEYLAAELEKSGSLEGLRVYLFSEEDTRYIAGQLTALAGHPGKDLSEVFGVDGRYGRHYSFLKAVVPLWSVCADKKVRGTFKIDLDQVFPQKELVEQTGKSAFEHFMTPLWGARGVDSRGREVYMGMIAGALVNEKDIGKSLFYPDVPLPDPKSSPAGESRIFNKQLPMAVSTRGEMMTLYEEQGTPDGSADCLSRVHVTGGTNGILNEALRTYRPFTPGFIGRAEDQSYLLSVLLKEPGLLMRYVHEPGLIMRHDKDAFAGESIAAAKLATWVGDLLRVFYFSFYARFLPGGLKAVKEEIDPFTGCFVTPFPFTQVFLRLILKVLSEPENRNEILALAVKRLGVFVNGGETPETVESQWKRERAAWDLYYNTLDNLEERLSRSDSDGRQTAARIRERMEACRIN